MFIRLSGNTFSYGFTFLVMKQIYDCRFNPEEAFASCSTESICAARQSGDFVEYQIDTTYENYFDNWYHQMDLMCETPQKYMAMGSVFLACAGVSGLILSAFVDRIGRKRTIMIFQALSSLAHVLIIASPSFPVRLVCFAIMGMS